jgi:tRNA A37 threonylcarbamoyladenosine synthetase subunit TsaC/SUA5/YrdC
VEAAEGASLGPLTATSLNRSGRAAARSRVEALALCGEGPGAPWALDPGDADACGQPPSTVLDLCGGRPRVLRWGAIEAKALEPILGRVPMLERMNG